MHTEGGGGGLPGQGTHPGMYTQVSYTLEVYIQRHLLRDRRPNTTACPAMHNEGGGGGFPDQGTHAGMYTQVSYTLYNTLAQRYIFRDTY
jgi:hypothetical protein